MFLDEAIVDFTSGTGGSGAVSFHREKHVPRGGPNGADGGAGGDVILIAERGVRTLYDFKLRDKFVADNGVHALNNKAGKSAKDVYVKVPVGTVVTDMTLGEVLCDLNVHGMKYVICEGGRGGKGNMHYVSSIRQVPNFAEKGAPGETVRAKLEMKLLADVGLIGKPNAGKSTLLGAVSRAKPKIGDYPFTTIIPNLGVVTVAGSSFVMADMPGLIEGAKEGKGLGHQFLKHIERTRVLVHVVDLLPIDETEPRANYEMIERELCEYSEAVWSRPRLVALNKADLIPGTNEDALKTEWQQITGHPIFVISAATNQGLEPLLFAIHEELNAADQVESMPTLMPAMTKTRDDSWDVMPAEEGGWEVTGRKIRRMVAMTDLTSPDAVRYLHRRLSRLGLIDKLRDLGAEEGDPVYVDKAVFSFTDEM